MKAASIIPPLVALVLGTGWLGARYQSLATVEAGNVLLREHIAAARSSGPDLSHANPGSTDKLAKPNGPIDWKEIADAKGDSREMERFLKQVKSMTKEELVAALDQVAALDLSADRRLELERPLVESLIGKDPELVLTRFADRLGENVESRRLPLSRALREWAKMDPGKATAWFDAQIAAGKFNSKMLDESRGFQPRHEFEAALMSVLLTANPAAAAARLSAVPVNQRRDIMRYLSEWQVNDENQLAFANLVRSQLPADLQTSILLDGTQFWGMDDYPKFTKYMNQIEATPAERISCVENFAGSTITRLSNKRKVTGEDLDTMRGWFREISPDTVDVITGKSLSQALLRRNASMRLAQASELVVELLKSTGSDEVLASFLETATLNNSDIPQARILAGKISDETRRAAILKRFE